MRVAVICRDSPSYSRYGGMQVSLALIAGLRSAGSEVLPIFSYRDRASVAASEGCASALPRRKGHWPVKALAIAGGQPIQSAVRLPDASYATKAKATLAQFRPDLVVLEGLSTLGMWRSIRPTRHQVFTAVREQNWEPEYLSSLLRMSELPQAAGVLAERVAYWHALRRLSPSEVSCMCFFSEEDRRNALAMGHPTAKVVPGVDIQIVERDRPNSDQEIVYGYFGSLDHAANVVDVQWLLREVWAGDAPPGRLVIAGRNPGESLIALIRGYPRVELLADVPDVADFYRRIDVVLNPATTGSGFAVKTLEALGAGRPVVGRSAAFRGLPYGPLAGVHRAETDSVPAFLGQLQSVGASPPPHQVPRSTYEKLGSPEASARSLLELFESLRSGTD